MHVYLRFLPQFFLFLTLLAAHAARAQTAPVPDERAQYGVICRGSGRALDVERAATELPAAERALVRIVGLVPEESESTEPTELRLSRTGEALARFRARAPEGPGTAEASPGFDLREMLGRLMRFVSRSVMTGFVNALAILIFLAQMPELIGVPWMTYPMIAAGLAIVVLVYATVVR